MDKIGICGHLGLDKQCIDGQTIKTRTLKNALEKEIGKENIHYVDSMGWKKKPIVFLGKCIMLGVKCNHIIILPAQRGVKIFIPLFIVLKRIFKFKLHYMIIGAWIGNLLKENKTLHMMAKKIDKIYSETYELQRELENLELAQVYHIPNFKDFRSIPIEDVVYKRDEEFKFCTFSRIDKEKGIKEAIDSIRLVNEKMKDRKIYLDIYGPIDERYKGQFKDICIELPTYIRYKGIVDANKSIEVIKKYDVLLFPTLSKTEGVPGTIIDAYAAGVPVIASNWNSARDVIKDGITGYIYGFNNTEEFVRIIDKVIKEKEKLYEMKKECILESQKYISSTVVKKLVNIMRE